MKPIRSFLFFLSILILLIFISRITGNKRLSSESFLTKRDTEVKKMPFPDTTGRQKNATPVKNDQAGFSCPDATVKKHIEKEGFIYASSDSVHLGNFFSKLAGINNGQLPVRILYFGDSQIENGYISAVLRKKFQEKFGGKGPGFVPVGNGYNAIHKIMTTVQDSWQIYSFLDRDITNTSLIFRQAVLSDTDQKGWIRISRIRRLAPGPDYTVIKLFYTADDSTSLHVSESGNKIYSGKFPPSRIINAIDFSFNKTPEDIRFVFGTNDSLSIQGLSLESPEGIIVDNIAMRGRSYPSFTVSDENRIEEMVNLLNPGLFILHYGVNLVPYPSKNYIFFRIQMKKQILFLKKICPDIPVLLVGVSDMARLKNGELASYPNIGQIKQIQKEVADETGAIFWDLEAFMGGPGSMVNWVNARPPLGKSDYIHFSEAGDDKIGTELARLLLAEFDSREK